MKTELIPFAVAAALLLAVPANLPALSPRQHPVNGVVAAIDRTNRTVTLTAKDGAAPGTFVWNDRTRFSPKNWSAKCKLGPGQTVRGSYRHEAGQNVLREVSSKGTGTGTGCVAGYR